MNGPSDARLERELRDLYRDRHPGAAPLSLRTRVDRVPDHRRPSAGRRAIRVAAPLVGLAAALAIVVLAAQALRAPGGPATAGASAAPTSAASFDPSLVGPGIGSAPDAIVLGFAAVMIALVLGSIAVIVVQGRWRLIPAGLAAAVVGYVAVGTLAPVSIRVTGWSPGLGVVTASMPPGATEVVLYEVAQAQQPFSLGLDLIGEGPLPIRVEGLDVVGERPPDRTTWRAVWLEAEPESGMTGPARPFEAFDASATGQSIWLVGSAGRCALGPSFDPSKGGPMGFGTITSVRLRVSVLGWPRVVELPLDLTLQEPRGDCSNLGEPSPAASP